MSSLRRRAVAVCLAVSFVSIAHAADGPVVQTDDPYFTDADAQLRAAMKRQPNVNRAKNVILFVGDGMGISTVTAARIYQGQKAGRDGVSNKLVFESLPHSAFSRTYSHDSEVTDSAPSASAMTTGAKSRNGVINVDSSVEENDCKAGLAHPLTTIAELAEIAGMATGAVTTTRITHATPAAVYSHVAGRDWEGDADMKPEDIQAGCVDIARQLVEMRYGDGLEVAMGGGRSRFLPAETADPEYPDKKGTRRDGKDLTQDWLKRYGAKGAYLWDRKGFDALDPKTAGHVLALFEPDHMQFELDRAKDVAGEPSLAEMTTKAIAILKKNPKGFFLLVEGGKIDHAHHGGNAARALEDTAALDDAVKAALAATSTRDTLIVVTADHSHTLMINGYPSRNNPILGKVDDGKGGFATARDGKPYTTLSYSNGPGAEEAVLDADGKPVLDAPRKTREDLTNVDTTAPDFRQQALVPMRGETHGGEDVAIYASGPWAHLFSGTVDENYTFHVMNHAARIKKRAETAIRAGGLKRR
jgi:alkaline phosphatase